MAIDNTIVKKVGKLAKIKIEQSEEKKLIQELNNILDWVDELKQVDTKGIEPMLSVFNESMKMREDKVEQNFSSELITKNSPEKQSGFFVVPKVVE